MYFTKSRTFASFLYQHPGSIYRQGDVTPVRPYPARAISFRANFLLFSVGNRTALPLEHWNYDTLTKMALVS